MKSRLIFLISVACIFAVRSIFADDKKCYAPVVCSTDRSSEPTWQQIYPPAECKAADSTPDPRSSGPSNTRGPKGDKGDPGETGLPGAQGSTGAQPGVFNESFIRSLTHRLEATEAKLKRVTQAFDLCPVFYQDACFYVYTNESLPLDEARAKCIARGGDLANVYTEQHRELIMSYSRKYKMNQTTFIGLYSGMTLDSSSWALLLRDGSPATITPKWIGGLSKKQSEIYVSLNIEKTPNQSLDAFVAADKTTRRGFLCEI